MRPLADVFAAHMLAAMCIERASKSEDQDEAETWLRAARAWQDDVREGW